MRFQNTFQAQTPIGQSLQNIAQIMFSGPSPVEAEKARLENDYLRSRTNAAATDARKARAEMDAAASIPGMFQKYMFGSLPEQGRPDESFAGPMPAISRDQYVAQGLPAIAGAAASAGKYSQIGDLFRAMMANTPGTSDNAVIRSMAGAGTAIGENQAVSLPGQDAVRAANAQNDLTKAVAVENAKPLTYAQVRGGMLADAALTPAQQLVVIGAQNPYNANMVTGADNHTYRIDQNDPLAVSTRLPVQVPGADGSPALGALDVLGTVGSANDDPLTAARRTREAEAASMGITVEELDFVKRFEEAQRAAQGLRRAPPAEQDAYDRIMDKIRIGAMSMPAPPGYTVIQ